MRLWCGLPASVSRVVHLASCSATLLHWYRKLRYRLLDSARATQASLCVVVRTQLNDKTAYCVLRLALLLCNSTSDTGSYVRLLRLGKGKHFRRCCACYR